MGKGEKETLNPLEELGLLKCHTPSRHEIVIARRCSKAKGISSDWKNGGHDQVISPIEDIMSL